MCVSMSIRPPGAGLWSSGVQPQLLVSVYLVRFPSCIFQSKHWLKKTKTKQRKASSCGNRGARKVNTILKPEGEV